MEQPDNKTYRFRTVDLKSASRKDIAFYSVEAVIFLSIGIFALLIGKDIGMIVAYVWFPLILSLTTLHFRANYIDVTDCEVIVRKGFFRPKHIIKWESIKNIDRGTGAQPASLTQHDGQITRLNGLSWPDAKLLQKELSKRGEPRV